VTPAVASWAIFALGLPVLGAYLAARGIPTIEPRFWLYLSVNAVLYIFSFRLYVSALELGDLGLTYPLLALTPVLVMPVEWLLLGDAVEPRGLAGVLLVAAGVYALNFDVRNASPLEPFRAVARDPGARRMLGVALIWSVSGTVDRGAVLASSAAFYGVAVAAVLSIAYLPFALRAGRGAGPAADGARPNGDPEAGAPRRGADGAAGRTSATSPGPGRAGLADALRDHGAALVVQGLLFAAMFVTQMEALDLSLAAYVLAIKRSGTLLIVLLGAAYFGEERTLPRLAGTVVILAGAFLVASG